MLAKKTFQTIFQLVFCLACLATFAACSTSSKPEVKPVKYITKKSNQQSEQLPFTLKITDDLNDGENLFVRTKISALNSWDREFVYLQLKGFNQGELKEQLLVPLSAAIKDQHPQATQKYLSKRFKNLFLIFSLPSEELTDYQLELIWGKEATASLTAVPELDLVVVKNVSIIKQKDCSDCPQISILKASIENKSEQAVVSIILEVGFELFNKKQSKAAKMAKQVIEINDLILPPNSEQDLEFELSELQSSQKGLIPIVHILNYQLKSE